jgi:FkbH-like protein
MDMLRRFGIEEYFLYPQISWEPKSRGLRQIANDLSIGMDTFLFVDDSVFEREEVKAGCPEVTVIDVAEYLGIPARPECQCPITEEARRRRMFYREQAVRQKVEADIGDYTAFLRQCGLKVTLAPLSEANAERVHELTQRTNQMNFSGNRYSRQQVEELLTNDAVDTYVIDCVDQFGAYGTVGFCLVDRSEARMIDLMFSCRVQAKRVEHAFLAFLLRKYNAGDARFSVNYRKTKKNAAHGRVFEELGFEPEGDGDGVTRLVFPEGHGILDEDIVTIDDRTTLLGQHGQLSRAV